jgi:hypothetical protein
VRLQVICGSSCLFWVVGHFITHCVSLLSHATAPAPADELWRHLSKLCKCTTQLLFMLLLHAIEPAPAEDLWRQLSQLGVEKEPEAGYDRDDQASTFSNKDGAAGVLAHMERCRCAPGLTAYTLRDWQPAAGLCAILHADCTFACHNRCA